MEALTYTEARANLARTIDAVCDNHTPVIITKKRDKSVVMISLEDYEALEETAYLLRSPQNAERLLAARKAIETGQGEEHPLCES